jgi:thiol-disulfide isomerase/thioredoxin
MRDVFAWVFENYLPLFGTVVVLAAALLVRIGRPRRWFHFAGDALGVAIAVVGIGGLAFFSSVRGALERRVQTISFEREADHAVQHVGDYEGKVVVLNFWATWCGPCRKEMPDLNRLAEAHSGDDVVVLTISDESWDAIGVYTARFPMKTVVGRFTSDPPRGRVETMAYQGRPTTLVLDRTGRIRKQLVGALELGELEKVVRAAM